MEITNVTVIGIDPSLRACGVSDGTNHLVIKTEKREEDHTQAADLKRRCQEIISGILAWLAKHGHTDPPLAIYVEAPAFGVASMANHLYELGWLMYRIHNLTESFGIRIVEVPPATLRKWATGKGNTPKDAMKLAVFKKFGIEFEDDAGCDKLFAYLLAKFGEAVETGELKFEPSAKRGDKHKKKRAA
jgi:crossover junction endodeoxyribonuclease RuvC